MKFLKESKTYMLIMIVFFLFGIVLSALGAQKTVPKTKKIIKTSKPAPVSHKMKNKVTVPNLIGKSETQAKMEIKKLGLKVGKIQYQMLGKGKPSTVMQQKPKAKTKVSKGSMVDLWVLKSGSLIKGKTTSKELRGGKKPYLPSKFKGKKITPKIKKQGKNTYAIFPERVQDVKVKDSKGRILQQFRNKGKRFNISRSIAMVKGGKIKFTFFPSPKTGGHRKLPPLPYEYEVDPQSELEVNIERVVPRGLEEGERVPSLGNVDRSFLDSTEPSNNTVFQQIRGSKVYSGNIGGPGDPVDRLEFRSYPSSFGSVVTVQVLNGNVDLTLHWGNRIAGIPILEHKNNFWMAIASSSSAYFSVFPIGGETTYSIAVSYKHIKNPMESVQTENNPMFLKLGGATKKGALSPKFQVRTSDREDWFYFREIRNRTKVKVTVTEAGLPANHPVRISLYYAGDNASGNVFQTVEGTPDEAVLNTYQEIQGQWKIRIGLGGMGTQSSGTGIVPACYYKRPFKVRIDYLN